MTQAYPRPEGDTARDTGAQEATIPLVPESGYASAANPFVQREETLVDPLGGGSRPSDYQVFGYSPTPTTYPSPAYSNPSFDAPPAIPQPAAPHAAAPSWTGYPASPAYQEPPAPNYANPVYEAPAPGSSGALAPWPGAAYPSTYGYGYGAAQPEHPQAVLVLVLGVLGLFTSGLTAPFAWVIGSRARADMRRNPGAWRPSGALTTGWVLGIIGTVLWLLVIGFVLLAIMLFMATA